jgi:hypothetical protein
VWPPSSPGNAIRVGTPPCPPKPWRRRDQPPRPASPTEFVEFVNSYHSRTPLTTIRLLARRFPLSPLSPLPPHVSHHPPLSCACLLSQPPRPFPPPFLPILPPSLSRHFLRSCVSCVPFAHPPHDHAPASYSAPRGGGRLKPAPPPALIRGKAARPFPPTPRLLDSSTSRLQRGEGCCAPRRGLPPPPRKRGPGRPAWRSWGRWSGWR